MENAPIARFKLTQLFESRIATVTFLKNAIRT